MNASLPPISFEFFPPKTQEGAEKLVAVRTALARFQPEFFSVTFGAGGTTRDRTLETVLSIREAGLAAAPHLSCIGSTQENIHAILTEYASHGIKHLVALRGDIPSGVRDLGEFRYANELVAFIRQHFGETFHIEVAAYPEYHPQSRSALEDIENFCRKVRAGADSAITQYFFNADAYGAFVEEVQKRGVTIPIVPGIMPITQFTQLARFSDACGAEIPRWLRLKLQAYGDDTASIKALGLDFITALCERLIQEGAPSLHFYTMNQSATLTELLTRLGYQPVE